MSILLIIITIWGASALILPYGMDEFDIDMYYKDVQFTIKDRIVTLL